MNKPHQIIIFLQEWFRPFERRDLQVDHEFSEELSDGGERDEFIKNQKKIKK